MIIFHVLHRSFLAKQRLPPLSGRRQFWGWLNAVFNRYVLLLIILFLYGHNRVRPLHSAMQCRLPGRIGHVGLRTRPSLILPVCMNPLRNRLPGLSISVFSLQRWHGGQQEKPLRAVGYFFLTTEINSPGSIGFPADLGGGTISSDRSRVLWCSH